MAGREDVSGIDKVFCNVPAGDETGLVPMNQEPDEGFEAVSNSFSDSLGREVLEGNWSELIWRPSRVLFWEKDYVGLIEAVDVGDQVGEVVKEREN